MKVLPFKIPKTVKSAFIYQEDKSTSFYNKFHAHEEIQVSFIINGTGELFVGDTILSFKKNSVFVFGSNLPHLFKSDAESKTSHMKSVFFTLESLGTVGVDLLRERNIQVFFEDINRGFIINSHFKEISKKFADIGRQSSMAATISFFQILELLLKAEKQYLSHTIIGKNYTENEGKRMGNILNLAISNYHRSISLAEAAEAANMSKNAFCRYFKLKTNKTFFEFLIELRIENACKLLRKNKALSINEISESCGFNSISHFNRKFKLYKKQSPNDYRKQQFQILSSSID